MSTNPGEVVIRHEVTVRPKARAPVVAGEALQRLDGLASKTPLMFDDFKWIREMAVVLRYNIFRADLELAFECGVTEEPPPAESERFEEFVATSAEEVAWKKAFPDVHLEVGDWIATSFTPGSVAAAEKARARAVVGHATVEMQVDIEGRGKKSADKTLRALDGVAPDDGGSADNLKDLPGIENIEWVHLGFSRLEYRAERSAVVAVFRFEVTKALDNVDLTRLSNAMAKELYGEWGMNLTWKIPERLPVENVSVSDSSVGVEYVARAKPS